MQSQTNPRWAESPAPGGKPLAPILKIGPGEPVTVICLSTRPVGVWTHYTTEGRTVPCTGDASTCLVDHRYTSQRWQGWIAVQSPYGRQYHFTCLTEACVRNCPQFTDPTWDMRGQTLKFWRTGKGANSRLLCYPQLNITDIRRLYCEPDVRAFLLTLWGQLTQYRKPACRLSTADPLQDPIFTAQCPVSTEGDNDGR